MKDIEEMTDLTATQTQVALLQMQMRMAHNWLEGTMQGVTPAIAHWLPEGKPGSIGSEYAHVATNEDYFVNVLLRRGAPLLATSYAGKVGLGELPPTDGSWGEWSRTVQVDLDKLRNYAHAVYAATDDYLASITDETLQEPIDVSSIGLGMQTVASLLTILLANVNNHCGEISTLKGLQGLTGYPM
jgi:hypothetical protein